MPLLTALSAGRAAFQLIPKNKEAREKRAEQLKKGFQWVKGQIVLELEHLTPTDKLLPSFICLVLFKPKYS